MIKKQIKNKDTYTIIVGGQAGDGSKQASISLSQLLHKSGFEFFMSFEYPSLIRGGHNFSRISFSKDKVYNDLHKPDIILALNQETIDLHKKNGDKDLLIFADVENIDKKSKAISIPASSWVKEIDAPLFMRSSALLGAIAWHFDLKLSTLKAVFKNSYGENAVQNILLAEKGYKYAHDLKISQIVLPNNKNNNKNKIMSGNQAFAEGLVKAGLKNYFAYPMTPASSILHYLAKKSKDYDIKVIQPENEIAVINMALGASYTGVRSAVATSGGGFALMTEALAMAGVQEMPIVIGMSQRAGTSTGVATGTGQGDLNFARNIPGEYPRLVVAPGDTAETYFLAGASMNLAWKYQLPAIILLDKHLSESMMTTDLASSKVQIIKPKLAKLSSNYCRYAFTKDGISPLAFPGDKDVVVKTTSYEHDEHGYISESIENTRKMHEKRFARLKYLKKEQKTYDSIKIYGNKNSKNIVVFWGSVKGSILEAMKKTKSSFKAIQILWIEPFDEVRFMKEIKGSRKQVCIENNFTGQLANLIRESTGVKIANKILKYDSLPFAPMELVKKLNRLF